AELLGPGDVVIAISTTGQLPELLNAVDTARAAGADVIAITSSKSALARKASICLAVDHSEDSTTFLSMISRILQLLLIDIMAVGISLGQGDGSGEAGEGRDGDIERRRMLISHLDI
ncbi:MAG TPA: SIS domain-containing protein, partial [Telluria sp.]